MVAGSMAAGSPAAESNIAMVMLENRFERNVATGAKSQPTRGKNAVGSAVKRFNFVPVDGFGAAEKRPVEAEPLLPLTFTLGGLFRPHTHILM